MRFADQEYSAKQEVVRLKLYQPQDCVATREIGGLVLKATDNFGTFRLLPGEALQPGAHETVEVFYVIKGTLTLVGSKSGETLAAKKGDMVLISPGEIHETLNSGEQEVEVAWFVSD